MIKLVAFDWNDTILADTNATVKGESAARVAFGLPPTNLREFREQFTIPIRDYWIKAGFDPDVFAKNSHEIHLAFIKNYEPLEKLCRTRSGVREILGWLKGEKIKSVIFSNHIIPHIRSQLERLKILNFFDEILARDSVTDSSHMNSKNKEAKLTEYISKYKIGTSEVLTVGDTDEEIDIAKRQGFASVALSGGYQSLQRLKSSRPDHLIHNLIELKNIIKKINGRISKRN